MQRYDAVLFDVDGTLIHSRPGIFNCFAYAFRKMGLDPDAIDCSRYLGPPLRWSFAQHFATDAEVEQAVAYYRVHYEEVGSHQCSLFPGVRQMMDTLKDAGLYMATATCKPVEVVTPILKEQGLFDYFDRIGGASMDESVDNKTDVIRLVLQDPRLAGKRILMVGDRQDDMQGAVNNQLPAAAVLYGYGSREEMEPWNPVLLAQNCEELTQYFWAEPRAVQSAAGHSPPPEPTRPAGASYIRNKGRNEHYEPQNIRQPGILQPNPAQGMCCSGSMCAGCHPYIYCILGFAGQAVAGRQRPL